MRFAVSSVLCVSLCLVGPLSQAKPQGEGFGSKVSDALLGVIGLGKANNKCQEVTDMGSGVCAILYTDDDCRGDAYPIGEVAGNLPLTYQNRFESILLRANCSFYGYDDSINKIGHSVASLFLGQKSNSDKIEALDDVVELFAPANENLAIDFDNADSNDNLEQDIEFVACKCGNTPPCGAVPKHLCAKCYDENGCDRSDWDNFLGIPITDKYSLSRGDGGRNGIESCLVRSGCSLTLIDTDVIGNDGQYTFTAPTNGDLHFDMNGNPDSKIDDLSNDAEHVKCSCPGEIEIAIDDLD
eukprot:maker-scaffold247_size239117-snap-gene-1.19 protein:Tk09331 transcript:maker-scaffold247_size239117-snap-gene-1.19-mRNA-1 annotation:"3-oxoacyl-acp synthase"